LNSKSYTSVTTSQDRDIEKLKFGHKDASKKEAVVFLSFAALMYSYRDNLTSFASNYIDPVFFQLSIDQYVLVIALFTVVPHFVEIIYQFVRRFALNLSFISSSLPPLTDCFPYFISQGFLRGMSWALKIVTDPFTDLLDFYTHVIIHPRWFLDFKEHRATYRLDIKTKKVVKVE
jgi:hypothetical protein